MVPRFLKTFPGDSVVEMHVFSDASEDAFGSVAYVRTICENNINVTFLLGKTKVAPLKQVSVPRLELAAATLAAKMANTIKQELSFEFNEIYFWTDSTVVLRYIKCETSRFQTFVANRVTMIREGTKGAIWRYVDSELNPADDCTRARQSTRWLNGPAFLYQRESVWPRNPLLNTEDISVLKIKKFVHITGCEIDNGSKTKLGEMFERFSSWVRLKKAIGWLLKYKCLSRTHNKIIIRRKLDVNLLNQAEQDIIRLVQKENYPEEYSTLEKNCRIKSNISLRKLNPVLVDGIMRLKGRLEYLDVNFDEKNPILMPGRCHVTELIIRRQHEQSGHMGLMCILSQLRSKFWIVKGNSSVRRVLGNCIKCKMFKSKVIEQQMANIPVDRMKINQPPFSVTGLDCFGPFFVKRGRSMIKRYGVIFTCLTMRAIHLEVAADLFTDPIVNSLRRFLSRRGQVKKIIYDQVTNFI